MWTVAGMHRVAMDSFLAANTDIFGAAVNKYRRMVGAPVLEPTWERDKGFK